ncbi:putative periplasmic membrane protein [Minicystis rosea]|nr:putative periplasmic membrane protein [Minicystis rosea]
MRRSELDAGVGPVIAFRSASDFEAWLEGHAGLRTGVWLKLAKKGSGIPSLTDDEAVDVGLCFGWISGQRKAHDEIHYLQKYVPRRPRSRWSRVNVTKVEALLAGGRMRPSGLSEVEAAKADGRWAAAYASQRDATVPADLAAALRTSPRAARTFAGLGKTRQYAILLGLVTARTAAGREERLRKALRMLEASTCNPPAHSPKDSSGPNGGIAGRS